MRVGSSEGIADEHIVLVEKYIKKVTGLVRVCDRIIKLKIILINTKVTYMCAYALQNRDQKTVFMNPFHRLP